MLGKDSCEIARVPAILHCSTKSDTEVSVLAAKQDPLKHCHLLIQELELTDIKISAELEALRSDTDEDLSP